MTYINKEPVGDLPQGTSYFCHYVKLRIQNNRNFLAAITGQTGSGKSYAALSLMEALNPKRADIKNVCLSAKQFMERINSGELKKGDVLIWDEAGIDLNARKWQSIANRLINYLLQTFRNMNLVVIFTLPYFSFLDAAARKLLHCRMETVKINQSEKYSILKPFLLQTAQESGKSYRKYLRIRLTNGGMTSVKRIRLGIPSPELVEAYEAKKSNYTRELNKEIHEMLENNGEKKKDVDKDGSGLIKVSPFQLAIKAMRDKGMKQQEIADLFGRSVSTINEHLKKFEKYALKEAHALDDDVTEPKILPLEAL